MLVLDHERWICCLLTSILLLQRRGILQCHHELSTELPPQSSNSEVHYRGVASKWWVSWCLSFLIYLHVNNLNVCMPVRMYIFEMGKLLMCCHLLIVYPDGKVCISILHPPGDDPNGYELATERWSPVHTVCDAVIFFSCCIYHWYP